MDAWLPMDRWPECRALEKPGIVFEVQNADGDSMVLACELPFPGAPWDWRSPPIRFRAIGLPKPRPTSPIPGPATPR
jgi:hypothetical protein